METNIEQIRSKLISAALLGVMLFIIPSLAASLSRIPETGWQWIYLGHIIAGLIAGITYLFRAQLSLNVKTHLFCILFLVISFSGAIKFGVSGASYYCIMSPVISTLIFGKRSGFIYLIISVSGLAIIGILHYYHIIYSSIDFNIYNANISTWLNLIFALIILQVVSVLSIGLFNEYFSQNIESLKQKSEEQEIAKEELKKSEERYRILINNAALPVIVSSFEGKLLFINRCAENIFGVEPIDLQSTKTLSFWKDLTERVQFIKELQQHGISLNRSVDLFDKNHKIISVLISSNTINFQGQTAILSVINDITEQKKAEALRKKNEELIIEKEKIEFSERITKAYLKELTKSKEVAELSESRYRQAQEVGNIGSWEFDIRNNLFWGSEEGKRIYGFDPHATNFTAEEVMKCVVDRDKVDSALVNLINENKPYDIEFDIIPKNGTTKKTIHSVAALVRDENGETLKVTGVLQDITWRKKAEEILKQKNKELQQLNAEKDKFFTILGHDLKSPFNSILGLCEILELDIREKNYEEVEKYTGFIRQSSQKAVDLLSNLLEWSRSRTGRIDYNPEYFEMVSLINEVTRFFSESAGQKSITINREAKKKIPVYADKAMISSILRNLLSNAIKFTRLGGVINISVTEKQNQMIITISDSGIGIPADHIENIFRIDKSYSTPGTQQEMGTGLGLILCKEFIEKNGGEIWVESEEGNGSKFIFSIPMKN